MANMKRTVKKKAWVLLTKNNAIAPFEGESAVGKFHVYATKKDALQFCYSWRIVLPCTIIFTLPKKSP